MDKESEFITIDTGKIVLSVPYTSSFLDTLDLLQKNKKLLGITGLSVSLITLEKVFLK